MKITSDMLFPLYARYGVKMGVGCALAYGLSALIGSPYAIWAVVSTIIAMQINIADSLQAGALRLTGTCLGAAIGVGLLLVLPKEPLPVAVALFFIATGCAYLTRYSNLFSAVSIASVVVLFSGVQHISSGYADAIAFGLMRVTEIAIGVGSALLVSLFLWPVRLMDTLRADLSLQFLESSRLFDDILTAFLSGQQQLPYTMLKSIEDKIWNNHERLSKARKHESRFYRYEHKLMEAQVAALDRTAESLRAMLEALNDYDEEGQDPLTGKELRALGDAVIAILRHLGGGDYASPVPDLVRALTIGVDEVESKMAELRQDGATSCYDLHKVLQFFAFYQAIRVLSESLLIALDRLQKQSQARQPGKK